MTRLLGEIRPPPQPVVTSAASSAGVRAADPAPGAVSRLLARRHGDPGPAPGRDEAGGAVSRMRRRRAAGSPPAAVTDSAVGDVSRLRSRRRSTTDLDASSEET